MSDSAFRYRWNAPRDGVELRVQRWNGRDWVVRNGRHVAQPLKKPHDVIVPAPLDHDWDRVIEPTPQERAELVRALELLDPLSVDALIRFMSRWGFLRGSPDTVDGLLPSDHAEVFCDPDDPAPKRPPGIPREASFVHYMSVRAARNEVRIFQAAVERYAASGKAHGRDRKLILDQLAEHGTRKRDPETLLPLIGSPLCAAWQHLAESAVGGQVPVRCQHKPCGKPFSLAETDKRTDSPPKYCSSRCRLAAWRGQKKTKSKRPKKASVGRRGRK